MLVFLVMEVVELPAVAKVKEVDGSAEQVQYY